MKLALYLVALAIGALLSADVALAHAVLITAEPPDGAVLSAAPKEIRLTFSEPVSPLNLRLLEPDGSIVRLSDYRLESETLLVNLPSLAGSGSNILSWRVASQDGHPVGGSLTFSVDQPTAGAPESKDLARVGWVPAWAARFVMLTCLTFAVGSALFAAWVLPGSLRILQRLTALFSAAGAVAVAANFALQLADALSGSFQDFLNVRVWLGPVASSFGLASGLALVALALAFATTQAGRRSAEILSALAFVTTGFAFAVSGHASTATPVLLMRPAVFVHALGIVFWIGSLLPLLLLTRGQTAGMPVTVIFSRFSRPIVVAVAALLLTGVVLAVVQLGRVDELWDSAYGEVLSAKLITLVPLFVLAAVNRFVLTPGVMAGRTIARRWMGRSIAAEILLGVAILGIVSLWRFTPPPRSMFAVHVLATGVQFHAHGTAGMANLTISPAHAGPVKVTINVMDIEARPLEVKAVDLVLLDPANGIEPIRRSASRLTSATWQVGDLVIPASGVWTFRIDLLVSDFEKVSIKAALNVPGS